MINPIDIVIAKRVKDRRLAMRLTQSNLGDAIGVSFQQIQKYERAINRISASRLSAIATELKVSVSYFTDNVKPETATPRGMEIALMFDALDLRSQDALEIVIKRMRSPLDRKLGVV